MLQELGDDKISVAHKKWEQVHLDEQRPPKYKVLKHAVYSVKNTHKYVTWLYCYTVQ